MSGGKGSTSGNVNLASMRPVNVGAFPEQRTPFGNLDVRRNFAGLPARVTTSFSPQVQALSDQLFGRASQLPTGSDFADQRASVENASFDRAMALLNPEFDRREGQLTQRLANQGLPQSSNAYLGEYGRFQDTRNQATENAANQAVLAGGAEQSRLAGLDANTFNQLMALFGGVSGGNFITPPSPNIPWAQEQPGIPPLALIASLLGGGGSAAGAAAAFL